MGSTKSFVDFNLQDTLFPSSEYYSTLLLEEIMNENLEEVKTLLNLKVNPNSLLLGSGISAMHLLAGMENEYFTIEVMHLALQECGGDPNVRTEDGLTPVHLATIWGRCKILELLLSFGGDPSLTESKFSLNAEDLALREHQWNTYAILATHNIMMDSGNHYSGFFVECIDKRNKSYSQGKTNEYIHFDKNHIETQTKAIQTLDCPSTSLTDTSKVMKSKVRPLSMQNSTETPDKNKTSNRQQSECVKQIYNETPEMDERMNRRKRSIFTTSETNSKALGRTISSKICRLFHFLSKKTPKNQNFCNKTDYLGEN